MSNRKKTFDHILKITLGILVLVSVLGAAAPSAQAATCRSMGVYTDYHWAPDHDPKNAPMIFIWNGANKPDPSKMMITYNNGWFRELVPSPSWLGIDTNNPWWGGSRSSGWWAYGISGGWYPLHSGWNDDWRWKVTYCT